jgi:hypothetical protein
MRKISVFFFALLWAATGTGVAAQTVRQNETAAFNAIKAGLDERKTGYAERDLLAEYGVFGKSIITGNAGPEENPFLFVFPVSDGCRELAFSLIEHGAAETAKAAVVFLGDAWSASNAPFQDLLESLDNPQNAALMYLSAAEGAAFAVTFFAAASPGETVKNPFHLTGVFAQYLEANGIRFSFRGKDIVLGDGAFPGVNEAAACLAGFAAAAPRPETSPDLFYIAAEVKGRKIILGNAAVIKITLLASAVFLFVGMVFAVIFNKKRVFFGTLAVFFLLASALLLNNPLRPRNGAAPVAPSDISGPDRAPPENGGGTAGVEVERTVFLDRIIYTIKAAYGNEPSHIALFYDTEQSGLPAEVYESPFPYEIDEGRVTFTLGDYPPNPFEAEISFPRLFPGLLTIAATAGEDAPPAVWTEQAATPE